MKYATRKRRLKRLLRPNGKPMLADCCGTLMAPAHRYAIAVCECNRSCAAAKPPPRRVVRLLYGIPAEEEARLIREIVREYQLEGKTT